MFSMCLRRNTVFLYSYYSKFCIIVLPNDRELVRVLIELTISFQFKKVIHVKMMISYFHYECSLVRLLYDKNKVNTGLVLYEKESAAYNIQQSSVVSVGFRENCKYKKLYGLKE